MSNPTSTSRSQSKAAFIGGALVALLLAGGGWISSNQGQEKIAGNADISQQYSAELDGSASMENEQRRQKSRRSSSNHDRIQSMRDLPDLVEEIKPAVVNVRATTIQERSSKRDPREEMFRKFFEGFDMFPGPNQKDEPEEFESESSGSGFLISSDGYVITNYHVVAEADSVSVIMQDRRVLKAEVVGSDKETDLALLKVEGENFPRIKFGNSDALRVGETVIAIGSPFGMDFSVTSGVVSAKARNGGVSGIGRYVPYIQTDVAINPGNSGGPLFNLNGEVIGVNTQIFTRTGGYMGISLSIPTRVVEHVVEEIKEHGTVRRGRLGVYVREVTMQDAESFDLPRPAGALIVEVEKESSAAQAGLQPGDVIVKFAGEDILYSYELPPKVGFVTPGKDVDVEFYRAGELEIEEVNVGDFNDQALTQDREQDEKDGMGIGILVEDVPQRTRSKLKIEGGAIVSQVISQRAKRSGIRQGDVVMQIQGELVIDASDFDESISDLEAGDAVWLLLVRPGNRQQLIVTLRKGGK